jgi:class 3 adenylate cyclase/tetratricopeptide (TPR) repeat protein
MKCPQCANTVTLDDDTCPGCGHRLAPVCGYCRTENRAIGKFCRHCGRPLNSNPGAFFSHPSKSFQPKPVIGNFQEEYTGTGERKWVTVLFSDLSGYSALCQRLDPEDVREMMNQVFKEIVSVIIRYGGYMDRIIGDEVLAVFGLPRINEDDPVRAVRAAVDIHQAVAKMSRRFTAGLKKPLAMHSGIATGLVVTGKTDVPSGRHGITGDTVHRALMLTDRAAAGEILVGPATASAAAGFFELEACSVPVKGEDEQTASAFRVRGAVERPSKIRRVRGLRARLVGRGESLQGLEHQLALVEKGAGACVVVEGEAGMGKSRLISEFRESLSKQRYAWLQGNAYAYFQNVPYLAVIDLLMRATGIRDGDSSEVIRQKLADELPKTYRDNESMVQMVEQLFSLTGGNIPYIPPESWKKQIRQALVGLIESQSKVKPTIICIEDLHWADPSTASLLKRILRVTELPVLFLISFRPRGPVSISRQAVHPYYRWSHIQLTGLSPENAAEMAKSMLQSDRIPGSLLRFVSDRLDGNPFFLEEAVNALVDSKALVKKDGGWVAGGEFGATAFSSGIAAVIAARLDRLGEAVKEIVQEAAVLGRRFSPEVLRQVSSNPARVEDSLALLKSLGLMMDCDAPGADGCQFKHSLIQEVAYAHLLKRQRRNLHEKIAKVMERQRPDRGEAYSETLAYHFSRGQSVPRAIYYLQRSGRKGIRKFSVIEAHAHYQKAYELLIDHERLFDDAPRRIAELLLDWFYVFNVRGRYEDVLNLMRRHEAAVMQITELRLKGIFLALSGLACQRREQLDAAQQYLQKALSTGEEIGSDQVAAYACTFLIWTYNDLGRLDEALEFSQKAEAALQRFASRDHEWSLEMDRELFRLIHIGTAMTHWFRGDCRQCRQLGDRLLVHGEKAGNPNSVSEGHQAFGMAFFAAGDYRSTVDACATAVDIAADPLYAFNARFLMAYAYLSMEEVFAAEAILEEITDFCNTFGYEYIGSPTKALEGIVAVAKGSLGSGVMAIKNQIARLQSMEKMYHVLSLHYLLGRIYLKLVLRQGGLGFGGVVRNLPFLVTHLPKATGRAQHHLSEAIRMAGDIGALGIKAQASFDLGRLHQARGIYDSAADLIKESRDLFKRLGADKHLEKARTALRHFPGKADPP